VFIVDPDIIPHLIQDIIKIWYRWVVVFGNHTFEQGLGARPIAQGDFEYFQLTPK